MIYLIDFDTRSVEYKTEDDELLSSYMDYNNSSLAIATISEEDDLSFQLSLTELQELFDNMCNDYGIRTRQFDSEEEAAQFVWGALEDEQSNFPNLTNKACCVVRSAEDSVAKPDKPKVKKQGKGIRANDLVGKTFSIGPNKPRANTACCIFVECIDDNMEEATFEELSDSFISNYVPKNPDKPVDEPLAKAYIRDAFNAGFIEESL